MVLALLEYHTMDGRLEFLYTWFTFTHGSDVAHLSLLCKQGIKHLDGLGSYVIMY